MLLLDGKQVAEQVKLGIKSDVEKYKRVHGRAPQLAVVSVGDDPASQIYLRNKEKTAAEVGISSVRFALDKDKNQEELDSLIIKLNSDSEINGILVQLPVPDHFKPDRIMQALSPLKDSDGFHPENLGLLLMGKPRVKPCTPYGIMKMLEHFKISVAGKNVVVVGRSNIVGKPMAQLMTNADATVTLCHSKTVDLKKFTLAADIVVVAAGRPEFLNSSYFSKNAVVVDVGIHRKNVGGKSKVVGDVDFVSCDGKVAALSPVPGGVGVMTVAMLLRNTMDLAFYQADHGLLK